MKVLSVAAAVIAAGVRRAVAPVLEVAGAAALVLAGWDVARPLGLAVAGVAALVASLAMSGRRAASSSS